LDHWDIPGLLDVESIQRFSISLQTPHVSGAADFELGIAWIKAYYNPADNFDDGVVGHSVREIKEEPLKKHVQIDVRPYRRKIAARELKEKLAKEPPKKKKSLWTSLRENRERVHDS
jgi:hypothetical protein